MRRREFLSVFSMRRENFPNKSGIELGLQGIVIAYVFLVVPLAGNRLVL
jgi:hypothetical protein